MSQEHLLSQWVEAKQNQNNNNHFYKFSLKLIKWIQNVLKGSRYSIQTSEAKMQQTASHDCIC